ncbi:hypothetical protein H4R21_005480 [Coemansia helicoidea]|uniref:Uncharacterized protein n=1 Tax=Coemansia helicoidea TaxID=1286919 RepID=A0ACC1KTL0_9FUNG|nr:hypothetical protein H4R21_005480 [Coemansia helicoidea]
MAQRSDFAQVGDYLFSQDLCVGVFDGTNYNSGTCEQSGLKSSDPRFPTSQMIIRDNTVALNYTELGMVLPNLTSTTQAQCVMAVKTTTACWIWNSSMKKCLGRLYYNDTFVGSDACARTEPVDAAYATYVRLSTFRPSAAAPAFERRGVTLKAAVVAGLAIASLLL